MMKTFTKLWIAILAIALIPIAVATAAQPGPVAGDCIYGTTDNAERFSFCIEATPTPTPTPTPSPTPTPTPTPTTGGVAFFEDFTDNEGLDRFRTGVFLRDDSVVAETSWTGDHDLDCGTPVTQRLIQRPAPVTGEGETDYTLRQNRDASEALYVCRDHLMTSLGDTSGYGAVYFSPDQTFETVSEVCWAVNMTDLGARQWWKVAVLSLDAPDIMSSVAIGPVGDPMRALEGPDRAVVSWSGAGGLNKMRIGDVQSDRPTELTRPDGTVIPGPNAGDDKPTRFEACFRDNEDGTLTFDLAGNTLTTTGAFPPGPLKVTFQDHNYTPNKGCDNDVCIGNTWHWDDIMVRD